ncbi:MAG: BTAD domain-containing putative transcriptional regulator [Ilumatobacter sp.]
MLRLFGTIEAGDGHTPPVPVSAPRLRMVLAILAAHLGERVSTDRLLDAMWGDDPPKSAMSALQVYVSKIRRLFEPALAAGAPSAYLRSDTGAYVLELPTDAVDIASFTTTCRDTSADERQLTDALDLWSGEPFAEFADEPWALTRSTELRQLRLRTVQRRYASAIAAGRDADIIDALRTDVTEHPYEERLVGLLMTSMYRLGDQRGALDVFAHTRELLLDELGLDPTPELQELQLLILQHDASLLEGMQIRPAATIATTDRSAMFGRSGDLERAESALAQHRLVTLTGPGGVGKTRLAQELLDRRPGASMIDLSASGTVSEAIAQTATVLGIDGDPLTATAASIAHVLDGGVVAFDNCEHLLPELGSTIAEVLAGSTNIRILATSRRSIGVSNEAIIRLEPLDAPTALDDGIDLQQLAESPGIRILTSRSGIEITSDNAADIVELHRRLDGLPLALELAAFRMRSLGAIDLDIAAQAQGSVTPVDLAERHRSLDTVLRASIDALTETQQQVLDWMSVFAGSTPLEAIVRLLDREMSAVEVRITVSELVDRSLVSLRPSANGVRYRLLETVRSHCRERLAAQADGRADDALATLLRDVAVDSLAPTPPVLTLTDIDDEVAAVLTRFEHGDVDAQLHLSLLTPVATYWYGVGRVRDARVRLKAALGAHPDAPPPLVGLSSALLGMISFGDGAFNDLEFYTGQALKILEPMGFPGLDFVRAGHLVGAGDPAAARTAIAAFLDDPTAAGRPRLAGLEVASTTAWFCGDVDAAAESYREQGRLASAERDTYFEAHALRGQALMATLGGDPERGLDLCRRAGEIVVGVRGQRPHIEHLATSAVIRREAGDHATARELALESLGACVRQFDATAATLTTPIVAAGALDDGDLVAAAHLSGWFSALCRSTGLYGPPDSMRLLDEVTAETEQRLDAPTWVRLRSDGASIGLGAILSPTSR